MLALFGTAIILGSFEKLVHACLVTRHSRTAGSPHFANAILQFCRGLTRGKNEGSSVDTSMTSHAPLKMEISILDVNKV